MRTAGDGGADRGRALERVFDLRKFDAVAANFDLRISAAQELDRHHRRDSGRGRRCDRGVPIRSVAKVWSMNSPRVSSGAFR